MTKLCEKHGMESCPECMQAEIKRLEAQLKSAENALRAVMIASNCPFKVASTYFAHTDDHSQPGLSDDEKRARATALADARERAKRT